MSSINTRQPLVWQQASNVNVADEKGRIQCGTCNKKLNRSRFSNNAIAKYQQRIAASTRRRQTPGTEVLKPNCTSCTGGPLSELQCVRCEQWKGLDEFSGVQRTKPDNAHCRDCQQDVDDREADPQKAEEEEEMIEAIETGNFGSNLSRVTGSGLTTLTASRSRTGTRQDLDDRSTVSGNFQPAPSMVDGTADGGYGLSALSVNSRGNNTQGVRSNSYGSQTSAIRSAGNPGFVKLNAPEPDRFQRASRIVEINNTRKKHKEMQAAAEEDDGDDWEL